MRHREATALETIWVEVPEDAMEAYEAALCSACTTVGFFLDEDRRVWRIEGVKEAGVDEAELAAALMIAEAISGVAAPLQRASTEAEGWLARTASNFPEQLIGERFAIRGTHLAGPLTPGRLTIVLDAGVAFGSGEHGSTRGCLRGFEMMAYRRPEKILDLGTGSGILAIGAALLLNRPVIASDIDPWSVRTTRENAALNGVSNLIRPVLADGWHAPVLSTQGPYDLVFANILARPLCKMARDLALNLAPGGTVILAGLLNTQVRMVLAAHARQGLVLERVLREGAWSAMVLRKSF